MPSSRPRPHSENRPVEPGKLRLALEQALLGDRDDQEAVEQPVDQVEAVTRLISAIRMSALKRGSRAQSIRGGRSSGC
jgi:hypothetical protein